MRPIRKSTLYSLSSGVLLLAMPTLSLAADTLDGPGTEEVMNQFKAVKEELRSSLALQVPCVDADGFPTDNPACDFAAMCKKISPNFDAPYLYVNEKGEKVPNFALYAQEKQIAQCFNHSKLQAEQDRDPEERAREQKKAKNEWTEKNRSTAQSLFDSIRRNREQNVWFEYQVAQQEEMLEEMADGAMGFMGVMEASQEELERKLREREKKIGKTLSPESRKALLDHLTVSMNMGPMFGMTTPGGPKEWQTLNSNPFVNLQLLFDSKAAGGMENLKRNQELYQKQAERTYRIFRDTQTEIQDYLDSKKNDDPEHNAKIENLKTRIGTIQIDFAKVGPATVNDDSFGNACAAPNAFYSSGIHKFMICPQLMELPSTALQAVIAHELGHSNDHCTVSDSLVKVEGEKQSLKEVMGRMMDEKELEKLEAQAEEAANKKGQYSFKVSIPGVTDVKGQPEYRGNFLGTLSDRQLKQEYKTFARQQVAAAIPFHQHPFYQTAKCLTGDDSVRARLITQEQVTKNLDKAIQTLRNSGATPETSDELVANLKAREDVPRLLRERGACTFIPGDSGKSQIQEAYSDKLFSEILERKMRKASPEERRRMAFEASSFFLATSCPGVSKSMGETVQKAIKATHCFEKEGNDIATLKTLSKSNARAKDEHSYSADRINRILMAHPGVHSLTNCSKKPEATYCE